MNKRTPKIILSAIIAIVVVGVSAKPLLIKYLLFKYDRVATPMSRFFDTSSDIPLEELKTSMVNQSDILTTLKRLGYLSSYSIPIQSPSADAEDTIALLSTFCSAHKIPVLAEIENEPSGAVLSIVDKPEARPFWDMFVRMYLEMKEGGQQAGAGYVAQGAPSPDP
jgi:hypothetical protein